MLNNLSIRDRLTLILLGPLVVLLAIAALAVRENLATSSDTNEAAFRVEMAQVNGRLFEAVRQEAAANQTAVAQANVDLTAVRAETDAAAAVWLDRVSRYRDLDVDGLEDEIRAIGGQRELHSQSYATGSAGAEAVYDADIALLAEIAAFDGRLNGRGESDSASGLLKASQLTDAAFATADAQLLGLWAAYSGTIPSSALATQLDASEAALAAYSNRAQADEQVPEASDTYTDLSATFQRLVVGDDVSVDADEWAAASEERATAIDATKDALLLKTGAAVNDEAASARSTMRNVGLLALAGLLVGAVILFLVVRSIRTSLATINAEANALAKSDLPKLAASLAAGEAIGSHEERPLLDTSGNDEIAQVAESLNEIRRSASTVAQQQTDLLQSGIAEMFVNLARRNQSLVDRQLEVIDDLEAQERDADRLAHLYRVDHLATRMRRNAESLLVLADNTTPRRRGEPVELREVVRVAIGEVEDYRRIVPIALDDLPVAAHVAHDVAHLLSELMENATQSSPPGTVADVVGVTEPDGSYTIHVMDRGTGIDDDRRAQLNQLLTEPPTNTLTMSKTLGLTVVARLARRMGVAVTLNPGTEGGTVASVSIPVEVVAEWARTGRKGYTPLPGGAPAAAPASPAPIPEAGPAPAAFEPAPFEPAPFEPAEAAPISEAGPASEPFAPAEAAAPIPEAAPPPEPPAPEPAPPSPAMPDFAEPPVADPVSMDLTALQDLAPLPTSDDGPTGLAPPVDEDISGLPPFPTLGPPEAEPITPAVSDIPGDDVFGAHEPIPTSEADFAPPPSAGDVFGMPAAPPVESTPQADDHEPAESAIEPASAEAFPDASAEIPVASAPEVDVSEPHPGVSVPVEGEPFDLDFAQSDQPAQPEAETEFTGAEPTRAEPTAAEPFDGAAAESDELTGTELAEAPATDAPTPDTDDPFADLAPPVADSGPIGDAGSPMSESVFPERDLPAPSDAPPMPSWPAHAAPGPDPLSMPAPPAPPMPSIPAHAAPFPSPVEAPPEAPTPEPASIPAHAAHPPAPSAGDLGPSPEATTPAGLVKRRRGASSLPDVSGPTGDRAAPSKRSPDQVKSMLSRYKTGLERGRTDTKGEGQS